MYNYLDVKAVLSEKLLKLNHATYQFFEVYNNLSK